MDKPASAKLSAILIAKNEEQDLPGALESLSGLAGEVVVVVDSASGDRTEELALRSGARTLRRPFDHYAGQKQAALERATGEWVLSLDADERVTPELRGEILRELPRADGVSGFEIPFQVHFMGRRLRFGGLGAERHLRLFLRSRGRFAGGLLHEGVKVEGPVRRLRGAIRHEPYRDLSEYLDKLDAYTTLAARKRFAEGLRAGPWRHLLLPWEFFARAVLRLGLLDGGPGLVWAGLSAFHSWLKYAKLAEMERQASALSPSASASERPEADREVRSASRVRGRGLRSRGDIEENHLSPTPPQRAGDK